LAAQLTIESSGLLLHSILAVGIRCLLRLRDLRALKGRSQRHFSLIGATQHAARDSGLTAIASPVYMALQYMASPVPDRELKKGSAELMILSLLENRPRHGYEIAQLIELRSRGAIRFNVASLYPLLYRLEKRNWIRGRWVERPGQRRRRYYRLTASGKSVLSKQRAGWREFVEAINLITGIQHA
jgi:PadR family transcriptional regulator PadR